MADSFNDTPSEGDGFTYEHYSERSELWLDFMADTGDGGNPTYAVARALAAPSLTVPVAPGVSVDAAAGSGGGAATGDGKGVAGKGEEHGKQQQQQQQQQQRRVSQTGQHQAPVQLPRADVLLLGGDLAYPNPCRETYEQRLFVPFQDAMPPPPHYYPGMTSSNVGMPDSCSIWLTLLRFCVLHPAHVEAFLLWMERNNRC